MHEVVGIRTACRCTEQVVSAPASVDSSPSDERGSSKQLNSSRCSKRMLLTQSSLLRRNDGPIDRALVSYSSYPMRRPGVPPPSALSAAIANSLERSTFCRDRAPLKLNILYAVQDEGLVGGGNGERFLSRGGHDADEKEC